MIDLDPRPALLVVDLQVGLRDAATVVPVPEIAERAALLAAAFRSRRFPVVLITADGAPPGRTAAGRRTDPRGSDFADPLPVLDARPDDLRVVKRSWSAFAGTGLAERLTALAVTQVVIAGVATSIGVESTARAAYDLGLNVVIVSDAVTDRSADAHDYALTRIFPRLGESASTAQVLTRLTRRDGLMTP